MTGWLDTLPAYVRHGVLMLLATLLAWAGSDLLPVLKDKGGVAAVVGTVVGMVVAALTPLVGQYGLFARKGPVVLEPGHE